jgi:hypothetical protein
MTSDSSTLAVGMRKLLNIGINRFRASKRRPACVRRSRGAAVLTALTAAAVLTFVPGQASAGDFLVTETDCDKIGGLASAVGQANMEPGSTIRFQSGVTFDMSTCYPRQDIRRTGIEIMAPMTIIGNHFMPAHPARHRLVSGSCPSAHGLRSTLPPHALSPVVVNSREDFHLQDRAHAGRT